MAQRIVIAQLILSSRQQLEEIIIRQKMLFDLYLRVFRQIAEQVSNHYFFFVNELIHTGHSLPLTA